MEKWEYKVLSLYHGALADGRDDRLSYKDAQQILNKLGNDGWEVITALPYGSTNEFVLKRRKE